MTGVRIYSSLPVVAQRFGTVSILSQIFNPIVTTRDIENSVNDQLQLTSLTYTRLKTKFNYASFLVSVNEDGIPLISDMGCGPVVV
jgi:hypothetical protein